MFFKHIVFSSGELIQGFSRELQRLERFARAACAKDRRYQEVLFPPKKHTDGDFFHFFHFFFLCFFSRCFRPGFRIQGRNGIVGLMGSHDQVLPVIVPAGGEDLAPSKDLSSSNAFNGCFMI